MTITFDETAVPDGLAERPQWVCWTEKHRNGKATKIPIRPDGSGAAKSNDMATWGTLEEAVATARDRDDLGIGYMFTDAGPYLGIDLDNCLDGPTSPADWLPALDPFVRQTYIHRSQSGNGLHVFLKDVSIPGWWTNQKEDVGDVDGGVEVYDNARFFAFTGDTLGISADRISAGIDLEAWLERAWAVFNDDPPDDHRGATDAGPSSAGADGTDVDLRVHDVISKSAYPEGERRGHPFHGSDTGSNFMVDEDDETFRCWRHNVTGNAGHLLGIEQGVISCGEWAPHGLDSDTWREIFDRARDDGYDIPEPSSQRPQNDRVTPDGGAVTDDSGGDGPSLPSIEERVLDEVLIPLNPDQYDVEGVTKITQDTAVDRFATILCDVYDFLRPREDTRGWRDTLYVYSDEDGIYEPHGESFIEMEAERLLENFATNQRVREIVGKIERRSRISERRIDTAPERLVVANGILDLTTGEISEHTPAEYHTTMLDVAYREDAECPRIDAFFEEIVEDRHKTTLYQLIAHCLYKEYAAEKAAMLLGEGQNGKSVFLSLVEAFLGEWNVSNQSLQKLNEDDWSANNLVGKLANVHPDLSDQTVQTMQMFKKLTGRDTIDADVKFEKPISFENYATLIFACNRMPVLEDDTRGNWRRWILIHFPNTFERGDDEFVEKRELMAELTDEAELEGLLARCVEEIQEWAKGRTWFPYAPDWREARKQIRRAAEPVYDFAHACLRESSDEDAYITAEDARRCYRAYASEEGLPPMSREQFGRKLLNQTDLTIDKGQKRVENQRHQAYKGVEFTSRGEQLLDDSEDAPSYDADLPSAASVGADEGDGGPEGRAHTVYRMIDEATVKSETASEGPLMGACARAGLSPDEVEAAIAKLKDRGDIIEDPPGEYRLAN